MFDPKPTPIPSNAASALGRAKLARLIAAIFSPPTLPIWSRLTDLSVKRELAEAAKSLGLDSDQLKALLAGVPRFEQCEEAYDCLIGHTVRSDCAPYEMEYRSAEVFQQSQSLADIAGYYRAFGFDIAEAVHERADHVAAEWEFMAILAMKERLAANAEQTQCCAEAQRDFLSEHLAAWMPAFFARLRRADAKSWYAAAADFGEAVLRRICVEFNVPAGPAWLELRPVSDEDSTISCGAPGAVELGPTLAAAMEEGA